MIKFLDLNRLNQTYADKFLDFTRDFIARQPYILGPVTEQFEKSWSNYCGVQHAVGVSSGSDALRLILEAYKILGKLKPGDEVIVPSNTYIATVLAVLHAGLKPVLIAPGEEFNLDENFPVTPRTKAVIVVHLYGNIRPVDKIARRTLAENLLLIEDAAQAHGAQLDGKKAGAWSHAAAFSFYPTKNLGALGDAGAVTTNDSELAEIIKSLRNYGQRQKYVSDLPGFNARLDPLQAGFLQIKLKDLDALNRKRIEIARFYENNIRHAAILKPRFFDDGSHVYHQYVIRTSKRDQLQAYLHEKGIQTIVHYPLPPHRQKALKALHLNEPVSEQTGGEVLSLPVDPLLDESSLYQITEAINRFKT